MYRKSAQGWVKHLDFILLDMVCLHLSFLLAYWVRHGITGPYRQPVYRNMALVLTLIEVLTIIFFEGFKNVLKRGYYNEFVKVVKQICLLELFATFYLFTVQGGEQFSRIVLYLMGIYYVFFSYIARICWKKFLKKRMKIEGKRSLLIITDASSVETVVLQIKNHNYESFRITGIAVTDRNMQGQIIEDVPVVAGPDDIADYVCREWVDEVFIDLPATVLLKNKLITQLREMGVVVHVKLMDQPDNDGQKQFVERIGSYTVLTSSINYARPRQLFIKRVLDIVGGLAGCMMTAVLIVIIGPMIYIKSPGPIFFSQTRVGKNGRKFQMYKFRSMYMDAEERKEELLEQNRVKDGMMFKLDWDPRIIGSKQMPDGTIKKGLGNYIRDLSLDEWPQFWNVLKGDMSLVGTRPPTVDEWEKYELHHRARLAIKPGITGMWQVSGRSNITDFEEVVKLDTRYINEWGIGLDLRILLETVKVVWRKDGAM